MTGNRPLFCGALLVDKRAWVHQLKKQVEAKGAEKASWYVSHYDPEGILRTKSCGPGKIGKTAANKLADTIHSQLVTGTYKPKGKTTWKAFRARYMEKVASRFEAMSQSAICQSLDAFERVAKPVLVASITTEFVDKFIANRLKDPGLDGEKLSPATVNKDLRYIRLVMNIAEEWGMITKKPKIRFLKQPKKIPTYIPPDHFAAIFQACKDAKIPSDIPNVNAPDWWKALLVTGYMTGWRIGQLLSLRWEDIDLKERTITIQAEVVGNKGKREERIPLHPVVAAQLELVSGSFDTHVFPWNKNRRELWPTFQAIQAAATLADGTPLPKGGKGGKWYGFHDIRRGFATMNGDEMDLFQLQALMQHKSLETTKGYVNMARRLKKPVDNLFVPPNLRSGETG
ncbi:tyrosine-type recombinase/integrase [Schlesneria sp. DSM 10557]|uniref:tyrosine-type recombinase/integrase n=1 Tax=Schlesneria sp. DSM 10557 TaxID=3044399 RepID=UPI0035A09B9A